MVCTKFGIMMQNGFSSALAIENFNFERQGWQTNDAFDRPILHHHDLAIFQFSRRWPSDILGFLLKFSTATYFKYMFSMIVPTFVEIGRAVLNIAILRIFSEKCKKSLDDLTQRGIILSNLEIIG